ncbi:restriction endonuclease subunit S [Microbacterium sp. Mu-80]|uniref:Restriction endonuclease subunit S n=1 Tax=Microbacterium bandirmense TaxID=3122050 RepID=A0ABU8LAJ9_9MICO
MDGFAGAIGVSDSEGKMSPVVHIYHPVGADARYLAHALRVAASSGFVTALAKGIRERSTAFDRKTFRDMDLPCPPLSVQSAIADYLDRETAQIDKLIAKQERLIATLRERRTQMIANAVTGSLASSHSTRPGGVSWLSSIPSHWELARVRHIADIATGYGDTVDAEDVGEFPFYVRSQTPLRSSTWDHEGPAVLTAGDGAGVAKVFHLVGGKFKAHQRVYVLDNFRRVLPQFFLAYFSTFFSRVALDGSAKSTVDSVRRPMISDMPICIPGLDEQRDIVTFVSGETTKIDTLIAKAERFIELSKERRAALITAAVTGQIEVPA